MVVHDQGCGYIGAAALGGGRYERGRIVLVLLASCELRTGLQYLLLRLVRFTHMLD